MSTGTLHFDTAVQQHIGPGQVSGESGTMHRRHGESNLAVATFSQPGEDQPPNLNPRERYSNRFSAPISNGADFDPGYRVV